MEVILHEPTPAGGPGSWLHFEEASLRRVITARTLGAVIPALQDIEESVAREGLHAAGFIAYEASPAFDPALEVRDDDSGFPLLWFGLFEAPARRTSLPLPRDTPPAREMGPPEWIATIRADDYTRSLATLREDLYRGATYQVNFTYRLRCQQALNPATLFPQLVAAQGPCYAAYVDTGRFAICSASPELFFTLEDTTLVSRPMKGTCPRGKTTEEDRHRAAWLQASEKNRSENVMIVDMIRNDMGRIAFPGTVVPEPLFTVERYPTVWQMVSTVSARTTASLTALLSALFPCASITGAPKPRTMSIIAREETTPRRIYTGCIGYLSPGRKAQFNVAIRTALIDREAGTSEYGTGGGIVWDSRDQAEYDESLLKAAILTAPLPGFDLIETLLWEPGEGYFLLERHLARLRDSAGYFGIPLDVEQAKHALLQRADSLGTPHRIRLLLSPQGALSLSCQPFDAAMACRPARIALAKSPVNLESPFLYHKTTHRAPYEQARSENPSFDDVLLWNQRGELTESTLANLVVEREGVRVTPPQACGLLAGTFRAECLARGELREAVIHRDELRPGMRIWLINSLRKWRPAVLDPDAQ